MKEKPKLYPGVKSGINILYMIGKKYKKSSAKTNA
jgi:hypothetical protein